MRLENSQQLLERVRASLGSNVSYYRVSKAIGATDATIANWRHGRSGIGREYVTRVAELLNEAPEYILACVEHEREPDAGAKKLWRRIAEKFSSHAASILLGTAVFLGQSIEMFRTVYYVKSWRWLRRRLAHLATPPPSVPYPPLGTLATLPG